MISISFQGKPFSITVIQVYVPTSNAEEAEVEQFCEDLQDLLALTSKKDVLFIMLLLLLLLLLLSLFSHVRLCATPHRRQPTRLPHPWDSPGKNTGAGRHFLLQCRKVKSEREVAQSCPRLSDPMDCNLPGYSVHGIFHRIR